jgi:hypothetical protein
VIDIIPLEVTSLKVLKSQLTASLEKASIHFETFVAVRSAVDQLEESQQCVTEIVGILKMLQMPGALQLTEVMLKMIQKMAAQPTAVSDFSLAALSQAFVWVPCYFEYVADRGQVVPSLVLPFINELRAALHEPLILESELAEFRCAKSINLSSRDYERDPELAALVPRLRLMYQVGLIGLLREENLELKLQLMHRSVARLANSVGDAPVRTQWRLTEAVLEGLLSGDLQLSYTRKRVLSLIERELKAFEKEPDVVTIRASDALLNELVYLVNLSDASSEASSEATSEVFDKLGLKKLNVTDKIFQEEKALIQGPDAETIQAMVNALQDELAKSKEILENASPDAADPVDLSPLISLFRRTSDILSIIGLETPGEILANIKKSIGSWANGAEYTEENLLEVADGLLFVESTLANLNRLDLKFDGAADEQTKLALMAKSQLDEAEAIVIREAQAGLTASKKDMDAFVESSYDLNHVQSIKDKLVAVRGGLQLLKLDRAAAILLDFEEFVQSLTEDGVEDETILNVLETMADVMIALEYYLSEIELHGVAPPNALDVAEQSLSAGN